MAKTDPPLARVRKLALALPDVEEGATHGYPAFMTRGAKAFAWFPKKKEVETDSLAVRMSLVERDHRMRANPDAYYTTPHYEGYTAVLARVWVLTDAQLRELLASGHEFMLAAARASKASKAAKRVAKKRR